MASLQHHDGLRLTTALLVLGVLAGCGGDRSGAAGRADTSTAVVTPDSAAMPAGGTGASGAADSGVAPAADTGAASPPATKTDTGVKRAAATPTQGKQMATKQARSAPAAPKAPTAAPTPAAQQQDTSKAAAPESGGQLRDAYHLAPHDTVTQAVYDGWKQFNLNCARCHGEDVQGTTIAPHLIVSLKPDGPINTQQLFVQTVCAGRPEKGMPSWCALGLEMGKINNIYQYVKGRSDAKISPGRPAVKQQG